MEIDLKDLGLVEVNKSREIPDIETVDIETYTKDIRRYQNSLIESSQGVPVSMLELDEISIRQVLSFTQRTKNPYTGNMTFGNIVESYMMSGAYPEEYLKKHFRVREVKRKNGRNEYIETVYERDEEIYQKIEISAIRNWKLKELNKVVFEWNKEKLGGLTEENIILNSIISGVVQSQDEATRLKYLNIAVKAFNIENKTKMSQFNVYLNGGGEKLNRTIIETTGEDKYDLGLGDLDDWG